MAQSLVLDLLIVGGGVNGVGIARDAAGRGLQVLLCEQGDLAGATSSASSKLIHGGLRYLEYGEFRLVREALAEREVLLKIAPHLTRPLRFVLPHSPEQRPAWMIRLGLFLYDHIGGRRHMPGTRRLDLRRVPQGRALRDDFRVGFEYSDCWVDDARLVVLNAVDARERGADIRTRTRCASARVRDGLWHVVLEDLVTGTRQIVAARVLVNAAGPWVGEVLNRRIGLNGSQGPRLIKGSHIVVRRLYEGEHAYILQNDDGRVVFVIPFESRFSLIGTTDIPFADDPSQVAISPEETEYLCRAVSRYFATPIRPGDVVHSYAGVRSLYDDAAADAAAVTRDYVLDLRAEPAPLLSVLGGKITTYRRLAEHAVSKLLQYIPAPRPAAWTAAAPLPGGDMAGGDCSRFLATLRAQFPWLAPDTAHRLIRAYGTRAPTVLANARTAADLGEDFGAGLTEAELEYLVRAEWARTADDVLWRRSKLGLHLTAAQAARIRDWMQQRCASAKAPAV